MLTRRISLSSVGCLEKKKGRLDFTSLLLGIYWFERWRFVAQGLLWLCHGWAAACSSWSGTPRVTQGTGTWPELEQRLDKASG